MTGLSSFHICTDAVGFDGCGPIFLDPFGDGAERLLSDFDRHGFKLTVGQWGLRTSTNGNCLALERPRVKGRRPSEESRGQCLEFSAKSRASMLWFMNSIDREAVDPSRMWFVTLTYPAAWSSDPKEWKRHLKGFRTKLDRAWGHMPVVWKLEFQSRGAPHFHLIAFVSREMARDLVAVNERKRGERTVRDWRGGLLREFRQWCSRAWFEVVGSGDKRHLKAGTNVEPLLSWKRVISYAGKYLAKSTRLVDEESGEVKAVGRFWGVWRKELFPRHMGKMELSVSAWKYVWRTYCKYSERVLRRPVDRRMPFTLKAFVPWEFVAKVLGQSDLDWLPPWQLPEWRKADGVEWLN